MPTEIVRCALGLGAVAVSTAGHRLSPRSEVPEGLLDASMDCPDLLTFPNRFVLFWSVSGAVLKQPLMLKRSSRPYLVHSPDLSRLF